MHPVNCSDFKHIDRNISSRFLTKSRWRGALWAKVSIQQRASLAEFFCSIQRQILWMERPGCQRAGILYMNCLGLDTGVKVWLTPSWKTWLVFYKTDIWSIWAPNKKRSSAKEWVPYWRNIDPFWLWCHEPLQCIATFPLGQARPGPGSWLVTKFQWSAKIWFFSYFNTRPVLHLWDRPNWKDAKLWVQQHFVSSNSIINLLKLDKLKKYWGLVGNLKVWPTGLPTDPPTYWPG